MSDRVLKASGIKGRAKPLGAAIAGSIESGNDNVTVEAVGAAAVNNAVKGIAIAGSMVDRQLSAIPEFVERNGITLISMSVR